MFCLAKNRGSTLEATHLRFMREAKPDRLLDADLLVDDFAFLDGGQHFIIFDLGYILL